MNFVSCLKVQQIQKINLQNLISKPNINLQNLTQQIYHLNPQKSYLNQKDPKCLLVREAKIRQKNEKLS